MTARTRPHSLTSRSRRLFGSLWVLLLAMAALPAAAQADVEQEPDRVIYRKVTTMEFGDAHLNGTLMRPSGTYTKARKKLRFRNLIELRGSFRPELQRSVSSL